jgi:GT2 family glycosyltransferase
VQFVDGDCRLVDGWIDAAREELMAHPRLGLVTGWRRELHPAASVYHSLAEREWLQPAGPIRVCGGDMMVRADAFRGIGGFDAGLISSEDEDFCLRMSKAGWDLARIPHDMTLHDIDMSRFSEWWRRAVRAGHGFAEVGARHPDHYRVQLARIWVYGAVLPILFVMGLLTAWWLAVLILAVYLQSFLRTARGLARSNVPIGKPIMHAVFFTIGKFPNLIGMLLWNWRRLSKNRPELIEYK